MAQSWSFSRVAYTSIYGLLYLLLLGLLLITPTDAIERSIRNHQNYNIWMLIIIYVVTIAVVCFVYFVRLYVNKTVLSKIPKAWIPIEVGDVSKKVRAMIVEALDRSASIAYEARPREDDVGGRVLFVAGDGLGVSKELQHVLWSDIEHKGWASPRSPDLPNLQYSTVISELPNLIEAKAMTLAPPDPTSSDEPPVLDPEATALLQRPAQLSLRDYIDHLASLGVLTLDETTTAFLQQYEYARFSTKPISNARFRELMHLFAEILRVMEPLDLEALEESSIPPSESDYGRPAQDDHDINNPSPPRSALSRTGTQSTQASVRRPLPRNSSWKTYVTAPNARQAALSRKSSSSSNSFAQTRHPYQPASGDSSSGASVRSSGGSSSVIRLATREDGESMPYVLNLSGTAESLQGHG